MDSVTHLNLATGFRGGERQTLALVEALAGHIDQQAIVRANSELANALSVIPDVRVIGVSGSPWSAFLASSKSDLLHSHEGRSVQVGAARALVSSTPFVVTRRIPQWPSDSRITRFCYRQATCLVTVSDAIGASLREYDRRLQPATIHDCSVHMTADPVAANRLREAYPGTVIVGQVGEFDDSHKGQTLTLQVASGMTECDPPAVFWLIGRGKDEQSLRAQAQKLANVSIPGWVSNLADYYKAMDVLVYPSHYEGLGSAMLEAMAFGVPVVAARVDGIPEIVRHGENGLLFEVGNSQDYAIQLTAIVNDLSLRTRLGAGALKTAQQFSASAMAQRYLSLYRQV